MKTLQWLIVHNHTARKGQSQDFVPRSLKSKSSKSLSSITFDVLLWGLPLPSTYSSMLPTMEAIGLQSGGELSTERPLEIQSLSSSLMGKDREAERENLARTRSHFQLQGN